MPTDAMPPKEPRDHRAALDHRTGHARFMEDRERRPRGRSRTRVGRSPLPTA
ncbi:hypothetical protein [Streptomyces adustus]